MPNSKVCLRSRLLDYGQIHQIQGQLLKYAPSLLLCTALVADHQNRNMLWNFSSPTPSVTQGREFPSNCSFWKGNNLSLHISCVLSWPFPATQNCSHWNFLLSEAYEVLEEIFVNNGCTAGKANWALRLFHFVVINESLPACGWTRFSQTIA